MPLRCNSANAGGASCQRRRVRKHALAKQQNAELGLADARRIFQHRLEHGLQLASRTADDPEDVGGSGLLLQRFAQLVEQPRVLDGDDGLVGEVADQLDLLVGERPHLLSIDADRADQLILLEHRHVSRVRAPPSSAIATPRVSLSLRLLGCSSMCTVFVRHATRATPSVLGGLKRTGRSWYLGEEQAALPTIATSENLAIVAEQNAELGLADAGRVRQHGLKDRLQLAGRAG